MCYPAPCLDRVGGMLMCARTQGRRLGLEEIGRIIVLLKFKSPNECSAVVASLGPSITSIPSGIMAGSELVGS
jgi:hypothetical protein